jgi:DNA-binding Lrp family transcriptional regulator
MKPSAGVHAYVFVSQAHPADLDRLRALVGKRGVRAVAFLVGPYDAVVAVGVGTLGALQRLVAVDIRGPESVVDEALLVIDWVLSKIPMSPRLPPTVAFVRINVAQGRIREVLQSVSRLPGFVGAAAVTGNADILLEIGGKTVSDVARVLLDDLQRVRGITSTVTSFATEFEHAR